MRCSSPGVEIETGIYKSSILMLEENRAPPPPLHAAKSKARVITAKKRGIRRSNVKEKRSVLGVVDRVIITAHINQQYQSALTVRDHTRHLVRTIREDFQRLSMSKTLNIFQLNAGKRRSLQESFMNDEQLKEFSALAITEPWTWRVNDELVPKGYSNWSRILPIVQYEGRWAVRSMLWIRKDIEHEQIPIQSADLTAVVLYLSDRHIMMVSVYIEPGGARGLAESLGRLDKVIKDA